MNVTAQNMLYDLLDNFKWFLLLLKDNTPLFRLNKYVNSCCIAALRLFKPFYRWCLNKKLIIIIHFIYRPFKDAQGHFTLVQKNP